ncbi:putative nucleotide-binding alpha-beta plait domain, NTF2-like domain-containing protein [Rosa chinensis]|uniref:Putative nucleotide-binding alpha-beta plait domain, NTF2-like domain-containing protein n=1 Tax=Rosa chinensis TaxID=74649 RepID=A0A2P6QRJ2_ROSCH|nr:nuclear transport factor 2 [Rosa chinensis]PRQ36791.1 putative nucleotide-binding alpha-beta plait domain, NTF2-like domain-containing protein [Rosa chinensis]
MATPFTIPVTAAQVGTYFVGQYYQVLQQQPDYVHQFYSESSTMLRIDGNTRDTASGMLQIHTVVMSLGYSGVEIKTAHSLESWNGGVLVMVSGSVHLKNFGGRRNFVQTFFLAPQEKGYFVLNDIFHFIDEDQVHQHPAVLLAHSTLDSKLSAPTTIPEPVANYMMSGETHTRDYVVPDVNGNGPVDNYGYAEQRLQQVVESENIMEDPAAELSNGSFQSAVNVVQEQLPASVEEPIGEPQKQTYASILRVAKGQPAPSVAPQPSVNKSAPPASDWNDFSQPIASSNAVERPVAETADEVSALEDEDEIKSVYVRNLPPNVDPSEVEEEFVNFGKLKQPEGVVIRSRKDVGVCYAFVEFEDMSGVRNAVKAGSVQIAGRQVYIEERRPNSHIPSRMGRGRGRGRGSYQSEVPRGRFVSRNFGRSGSYDGGDQDYGRPRGNGFYRPSGRQDRANPSYQSSRNGQYSSEY